MRILREEKGNVAILFSLSLVSLLGFTGLVTDFGTVYVERQALSNAVDAGALAGAAAFLGGMSAMTQAADQYMTENGEPIGTVSFDAATNTVTVQSEKLVPLYFARVFGVNQASVSAVSNAQAQTLIGGTGFVPIGVVQQSFQYGQLVQLSCAAGDGSQGNYGFLALGGTGASVLENNVMYGYSGELHVGDVVESEPGIMTGPVATAIHFRMGEGEGEDYTSVNRSSPRVMILPVINALPSHGRASVTIVGFAAFFLEGISGEGGHQMIEGRFLQMVVSGSTGPGPNFGLYGVHLDL